MIAVDYTSADDPALDARLTFIRRQSGLDYRAALFVLSPVSPGELSEFIKRFLYLLLLLNSTTQVIPAFNRPCTNQRSSITPHTLNVLGASATATLKQLRHTSHPCPLSERLVQLAHYVQRVGPCVMSTRWPASQNFAESLRLL